jgi:hypothetical protein
MRVGAGPSWKSTIDYRLSLECLDSSLSRTTIRLSASMPQIATFVWSVGEYVEQF